MDCNDLSVVLYLEDERTPIYAIAVMAHDSIKKDYFRVVIDGNLTLHLMNASLMIKLRDTLNRCINSEGIV